MACNTCGFEVGAKVKMITETATCNGGVTRNYVHGTVHKNQTQHWHHVYGCHGVVWQETRLFTPLPDIRVRHVE